ncbi:MAG: homoserine dehydrogenase [Actinomycetota bacterium]|nr:homoserine dehydrogenase [Actinomycetota bacterium]
MSSPDRFLNVGLLGCGTIGSGVYHLVKKNKKELERACGMPVGISRILVKDPDEPRPFPVDKKFLSTNSEEILSDEKIDVFIEVMGGIEPARTFCLKALKSGKHLITANKELLARHGQEIMEAAAENDSIVMFEASVGGGIPIICPLESSMGGDRIKKIMGIVNGTTNYVLSNMSSSGSDFHSALHEAQKLGYAEANPQADIEGSDAASKLAILCSVAFQVGMSGEQVYREGINFIRPADLANAAEMGYATKLLAIAERDGEEISARVHPTMIPLDHPLAAVSGNFNAIFVVGESVGELMFYGEGAGSLPTATAILGDVVKISRNIKDPSVFRRPYWSNPCRVKSVDELTTKFYMVLEVIDRPGVLAKIAKVFGENKVSLESVVQKGLGGEAEIVLITHEVVEKNFQAARSELLGLDVVKDIPSVIRVESTEAYEGQR